MTRFPLRLNGFSDYCSSSSLDQKGDILQVSADCSSELNGARVMGAALFTSHISIGKCLSNNNGDLVPEMHGGALSSCNCDVGFTLCDNCNGTSLQCSCLNAAGTDRKVTLMDMNKFLGIGLDEQGRVVLYCVGVYGDWNQCVKNGAQTKCPSILRSTRAV
ncbi:hypothetical protein DHEL01_v203553 [Diaporthe helianthi]|uniref:Cyanovirin-N domain-containing protein n=1 Tax=Diaporthe helianthi TaxID=158607 RepID=A0A2P5I6H5_DIAHE|nr:hypothetical protein DHEL01_v203553 [Diaporthe helianthi]